MSDLHTDIRIYADAVQLGSIGAGQRIDVSTPSTACFGVGRTRRQRPHPVNVKSLMQFFSYCTLREHSASHPVHAGYEYLKKSPSRPNGIKKYRGRSSNLSKKTPRKTRNKQPTAGHKKIKQDAKNLTYLSSLQNLGSEKSCMDPKKPHPQ